ncbi:MAG: hypothetical protein ACQERH_10605, partial [Acidobacteriota bacterium]
TFNEKFGEKTEEDLSNKEKKELEKMRKEITALQEAIDQLQNEQEEELDKFKALIEEIKKKLGIE